jgi:outer membrane lipoprotein-sorting protein
MITFFAFSAFSIAEAMTAERVIHNMIASYDRQMKDIKDITIIDEMMTYPFPGTKITYKKRTVIEGRTVYKTRTETETMGEKYTTVWDGVYYWLVDPMSGKLEKIKMDTCPYTFLENLKAAQVKHAGTDKVDGHKTHILSFKDMEMMGVGEMQKVSGKLWVDARDWVIRKMEMDMVWIDEEGEKIPVKTIARMEDFRKVNGMLMPYRTVSGMPIEMTPEEEQEMRKGLEEIRRELEQMPPAERKMIEKMMKPQIEMMERALAGAGIEIVTVVKDVKINTGLSDVLFDGSKLR